MRVGDLGGALAAWAVAERGARRGSDDDREVALAACEETKRRTITLVLVPKKTVRYTRGVG
jgi:hypothetical protein